MGALLFRIRSTRFWPHHNSFGPFASETDCHQVEYGGLHGFWDEPMRESNHRTRWFCVMILQIFCTIHWVCRDSVVAIALIPFVFGVIPWSSRIWWTCGGYFVLGFWRNCCWCNFLKHNSFDNWISWLIVTNTSGPIHPKLPYFSLFCLTKG